MVSKGQLWYVPGKCLGIKNTPNQVYKVQIFILCPNNVDAIVEVKHYKTKHCNKVHINIKKSIIVKEGVLYT